MVLSNQTVNKNKQFTDTESVFFIVSKIDDLRKYLFQPDTGFTSIEAGKNFDLIDVVLINSDFKYKPWAKENLEVAGVSQRSLPW